MQCSLPLLFSLCVLCFGVICERVKIQIGPVWSNAVFTPIDNKQDGATQLTTAPPWMAQVKHAAPAANATNSSDLIMCTAVCVKDHIFITASRCLVTLRVPYAVVVYQTEELKSKAFVEPDINTKQMFDDISFIVTGNLAGEKSWKPIETLDPAIVDIYSLQSYAWYERYFKKVHDEFSVIGFVSDFGTETPEKIEHKLYNLTVKVSMDLCKNLLNEYYQVPCFFTCTVLEHSRNKLNCQKYLRGLGHAVVQKPEGADDILVGITTWAVIDKAEALPVGFALLNSQAYLKNIECAEKIATDDKRVVKPDYYQSLCEADEDSESDRKN